MENQVIAITVQPNPSQIELFEGDYRGLISQFLEALGATEETLQQWPSPISLEIQTDLPILIQNLHAYVPPPLYSEKNWEYSIAIEENFDLLLINGVPFLAWLKNIQGIELLPANLWNFQCEGWPEHKLSEQFSKFQNLLALNLSKSPILQSLEHLPGDSTLRYLKLEECKALRELEGLRTKTKLEYLLLEASPILIDLKPLAGLKSLMELTIKGAKILTNVKPLEGLIELKSLFFEGAENLSKLEPLGNLRSLKKLVFNNCDKVSDLTFVANLENLETLLLDGYRSLGNPINASPVKNLANLVHLELNGGAIFPEGTLTALEKLQVLKSGWSEFENCIAPEGALPNLVELDIPGSSLKSSLATHDPEGEGFETATDESETLSWDHLSRFTRLKKLNISHINGLADLSPVSGMAFLEELDCSQCEKIGSVEPLSGLKNLRKLNLARCKRVTELSPLLGCLSLTELRNDHLDPLVCANLLASLAYTRKDEFYIATHLDNWIQELENSFQCNHSLATQFAETLAKATACLGRRSWVTKLVDLLQIHSHLDATPWHALWWGLLESGVFPDSDNESTVFEFLAGLMEQVSTGDTSSGSIGGVCKTITHFHPGDDWYSWAAEWLGGINLRFLDQPGFLRPIASTWCLALRHAGLDEEYASWVKRFTDPQDASLLDPLHEALAEEQLEQGDVGEAYSLACLIRSARERDLLLEKVVLSWNVTGNAREACGVLFQIQSPETKRRLIPQLAQAKGFLADPENIHRLLAATGNDPEAILKVVRQSHREGSQVEWSEQLGNSLKRLEPAVWLEWSAKAWLGQVQAVLPGISMARVPELARQIAKLVASSLENLPPESDASARSGLESS